jgi:hypothetical protein
MQTKKPSGLVTPSGLLKLVVHAAMGVAMGLAFALILMVMDPSGTAALIQRGGGQVTAVFIGTLMVSFGIGAALTGAVFMMTEDN